MGQHLLKGFCIGKEIINKMKKIFVNNISNKGLVSKIYKDHIYINNNKKSPVKKMGREYEQTFFQIR